jgi:hypothetical protein
MLEVETKLGKHLAGRTTKAGSLQRIAGYLVSMNVLKAATEQETMIITTRVPLLARCRRTLLPAALFLLLAAGAAIYYSGVKSNTGPTSYPAIPPVSHSTGTTLMTRPQQTTSTAPTVSAPPLPESRPQATVEAKPPAPAPAQQPPVTSEAGMSQPVKYPASASVEQSKGQAALEQKKTGPAKKKKKKKPPVHAVRESN